MNRSAFFIAYMLPLVCLLCLQACKRDQLQVQQVQQIESGVTGRLDKILFINDSVGFISGGDRFTDAALLGTHDGGNTWQAINATAAGKELYGLTRSPSGAVYACGFDGKLLRSYDNGANWSFTQMLYLVFNSIAFSAPDHGLIAGGTSFNSGYLYQIDSTGSLIKWDSMNYQLNVIKMVNSQLGYICGYGIVMKTTDGGNTWTTLTVKGDDFTNMYISPDGQDIWMCGYQGGVFQSTDGGNSWRRLRNGDDFTQVQYHLLDIVFKDGQHGWAAGENGKLIYTDDGGGHWAEYKNFTGNALRSISLRPDGTLLVCGDGGCIFRLQVNQ